jgi:hypothetical protein
LLIEPLPGNRVPRRNRFGRASFAGQAVFRRKFMTTATQKKKVHKVMHEHKKGTLKKKRLGQEGAQPEAGGRHCHVRIRPIEQGELTT